MPQVRCTVLLWSVVEDSVVKCGGLCSVVKCGGLCSVV